MELRDFFDEDNRLTIDMQEEHEDKVVIQAFRSVHCHRHDDNGIWTIIVQSHQKDFALSIVQFFVVGLQQSHYLKD
jgi:hypothetical protein